MHNHPQSAPLSWPQLPDETAVALQGVLHDFVMLFESHYLGQIERFATLSGAELPEDLPVGDGHCLFARHVLPVHVRARSLKRV